MHTHAIILYIAPISQSFILKTMFATETFQELDDILKLPEGMRERGVAPSITFLAAAV